MVKRISVDKMASSAKASDATISMTVISGALMINLRIGRSTYPIGDSTRYRAGVTLSLIKRSLSTLWHTSAVGGIVESCEHPKLHRRC